MGDPIMTVEGGGGVLLPNICEYLKSLYLESTHLMQIIAKPIRVEA